MNIFQRLGAALTRQIERENDATSLNTAAVMTVQAEPDWEAIAGELFRSAMEARYQVRVIQEQDLNDGSIDSVDLHIAWVNLNAAVEILDTGIAHYQAAKQVKP